MKYLNWYNRARAIAGTVGMTNFEEVGGWREKYHQGLTPEEAVNLSLIC